MDNIHQDSDVKRTTGGVGVDTVFLRYCCCSRCPKMPFISNEWLF